MWRSAGIPGDEDERGPAVILGSWSPDTEAEETLRLAKHFVRERALLLPMEKSFVPGKQRGYVVVLLSCVEGESTQAMTRRASGAVEATRKLRAASGHQDAQGKSMLVWAAVSQPPEVRRRSCMTAQSKRAALEGAGGHLKADGVKADYKKGTVTVQGKKVAGCAGQPLRGVD